MSVKEYRKKPVTIEALHLDSEERLAEAAGWMLGVGFKEFLFTGGLGEGPVGIDVLTLEGTMHGNVGDYLIRGVQGEFYFCKPDIFAATYEEA